MKENSSNIIKGAEFSYCRNYRFSLWRIWDSIKPSVMFVGLNPSTANETQDDPTIKSVIRIAHYNGFGGIYMTNCFPFISSNPDVLNKFDKNYYSSAMVEVNNTLLTWTYQKCSEVVFAWGNFPIVKDIGRDLELMRMFPEAKALIINKNGSPKHPLYCKTETKLIKYK